MGNNFILEIFRHFYSLSIKFLPTHSSSILLLNGLTWRVAPSCSLSLLHTRWRPAPPLSLMAVYFSLTAWCTHRLDCWHLFLPTPLLAPPLHLLWDTQYFVYNFMLFNMFVLILCQVDYLGFLILISLPSMCYGSKLAIHFSICLKLFFIYNCSHEVIWLHACWLKNIGLMFFVGYFYE